MRRERCDADFYRADFHLTNFSDAVFHSVLLSRKSCTTCSLIGDQLPPERTRSKQTTCISPLSHNLAQPRWANKSLVKDIASEPSKLTKVSCATAHRSRRGISYVLCFSAIDLKMRRVSSDTWCSIPSESRLAISGLTPIASRNS